MRSLVRNLLTVVFFIVTAPLWLCTLAARKLGCGDGAFVAFGQLLSLCPGLLGVFLRRAYYVMTLESCALDVGIGFGTWFSKSQVRIEPRVSIGAHCLIGSCEIGSGALLGSNIDVLSGRRQHSTASEDRTDEPAHFEQICLGRNVWVGNRAVIMACVGDHAVVGAGSIVVKPISPRTTAVGNPAREVCRTSGETREAASLS